MKLLKYFLLLLFLTTVVQTAQPCSSFVLKSGKTILLGKNFDWTFDKGCLIKNIRNTQKFAYFSHNGKPASWVSKYGSISFNQNGKDMPYGGMNEKGLVVEMLWLEDSRLNFNDNKEYLNELEWIQYQLDNFELIAEVISNIDNLKIYPLKGKIHYILVDVKGNSVIIEYLNGKPKIYEKNADACQAITNKTVAYSEKYKDNLQDIPMDNSSETYRYHQLENEIKKLKSAEDFTENIAFQMLNQVSIPKGNLKTVWSIVYNLENRSISFFSHSNKKIKNINLSNINFEETVSYFDINQNVETVLNNKLLPISEAINFKYMSASFRHLGFDIELSKELSKQQINQKLLSDSYFSQNYFHFDISFRMLEAGKRLIFAIMDSEENFKKRKAVTGGYVMGTTVVGEYISQIYGLKNGKYSMIALIDDNRNSQLDFDNSGIPIEKYALFNNFTPSSMANISFKNISIFFNKENAKLLVEWR